LRQAGFGLSPHRGNVTPGFRYKVPGPKSCYPDIPRRGSEQRRKPGRRNTFVE
jgi:hypothetical protein